MPGGTRKIARLPRVDDDDGEAGRGQRSRGGPLQAPGSFQHNQRGVEGLQLFYERHDATGIVRDGPPLPGGAHRNIPLRFCDINPHTAWHVTQRPSCLPDLAQTGSMAPNNCPGLGSPGRDDPRSAPVSVDQGYIGLSRPGTG